MPSSAFVTPWMKMRAAQPAGDDLRALAVDVVPIVGIHGQRDLAAQHQRVFAEDRRHPAQSRFPRRRVERVRDGVRRMLLLVLARKVRRRIFVLHLCRDVRAHARQRLARLFVAAVGGAPQCEPYRLLVVGHRQADLHESRRQRARVPSDRVRIVELVVADPHFDRGEPLAIFVAAIDRAE